MNGTFCMAKSRILAFIFSLRASSSTRTPAASSSRFDLLRVGSACRSLMGTRPTCTGASQSGKRPGVVLDEHAEEALDRAEERAVDHDGLMALAVFAHVFQLEARGQVEVELHGGELPQAAQHIDQLDVDLGAVEGGFAGDGLVGDRRGAPARASASRWPAPMLVACRRSRCGRCGSQVESSTLNSWKPNVFSTGLGKVDAGDHLVLDLARGAEDVRVVLGKAAHAQQAVHGARALVAIDVAQLGVAHAAGRDSCAGEFL